jgi:hypothetical protein
MPLLDHFHPPLQGERHWESFHSLWASALVGSLNGQDLPAGYFAEVQVHVGPRIEVDVATWEEEERATARSESSGNGGTATLAAPVWAPAATDMEMPAVFPDEMEVRVFSAAAGPTLVAAVELVSPGNKDRPEYRQAFAAKCATYLQQGVGLVIVDVVTARQANLHDELVHLLGLGSEFNFPGGATLCTTAYRPTLRKDVGRIGVWARPLAIGQPLPVMPLPLRGYGCVPLHLEASYTEARQRSRLG